MNHANPGVRVLIPQELYHQEADVVPAEIPPIEDEPQVAVAVALRLDEHELLLGDDDDSLLTGWAVASAALLMSESVPSGGPGEERITL